MLRFILFIALLLSSLTLVESTSATVIYTPGAMIAMTGTSTWVAGTNTSARFDVASALYASSITDMNPALITGTKTFTGTFYAKNIGWIVFASGSNQVSLNCGTQLLSNLTANCNLTGLGWSENVGDIDFAGVVYNPTTGLLSGSAVTFAGDISLTDIVLPLRPVTLDKSSLIATGATTLTVSGAWMYDAGSTPIWDISVMPLSGFFAPSTSHNDGSFSIDFSLATSYAIKITDTNGSETTISPFVVTPAIISTALTSAPGYYAATFCGAATLPDLNCPDGATRSETKLDQVSGSPVVADGSDKYTLTLKTRDQYGNRVKSGTMNIKYITTVKNMQISVDDNMSLYGSPTNYGDGDGFDSNKLQSGIGGSSETPNIDVAPGDYQYEIRSTAPTNTTDNIIKLDSIIYSSGGIDTPISLSSSDLLFVPLFTASVNSDTPIVNTPHTFETTVATNRTTSITPTIITTMQIGDGTSAEWRSLTSSPTATCTNYNFSIATDPLCSWDDISSIATNSAIPFAYTGTYTTWLPSATTETTTMTGYIYYTTLGRDILYTTNSQILAPATPGVPRITILGQSGEGVGGGAGARVDLINGIRKQAALLSRNRSIYDDVDYLVINTGTDHIVTAAELYGEPGKKAKRTIIVLGRDIIIGANIDLRSSPIAIIALTDPTGNGGDIKIKGDVTDIHSSLIAEHGITSERSESQLYIHGSLVSANPPREIAPTGCPYFATAGCTRSDYDLPGSRDAHAALSPADKVSKQSASGTTYPSPLVIEGDPRIIRDPAPAMSK